MAGDPGRAGLPSGSGGEARRGAETLARRRWGVEGRGALPVWGFGLDLRIGAAAPHLTLDGVARLSAGD